MKLLLFLALIVAIFAQNSTYPPPKCDPTYYGNSGEACDGGLRKCKWFYMCKNSVCTYGNIGAKCSTKEDCFGWKEENLRCVNQVCVKPKYPTYACRDSAECWTGTCVNGICSGKKLNEACDPNNLAECDYGMFCSLAQKKCVPQLRLLDMCNDYVVQDDIPQGANYNIMCPGGSVCMGRTGAQTCRPYRNGDIGDACNRERDGSEACKFGLVCDGAKNICVQPNVDQPTFACQGTRNCSSVAGETCVCPTGASTEASCKTRTDRVKCDMIAAQNKYRQCMSENNCAYEKNFLFSWLTDTLDGQTCLGYYCGNIAREYLCCSLPPYRREKYSQASSGVLKCDGNGSGWGIAFLVLFLLTLITCVIVGIVVAVIFVIRRRRQQASSYESVY